MEHHAFVRSMAHRTFLIVVKSTPHHRPPRFFLLVTLPSAFSAIHKSLASCSEAT